MSLVSEKLLCEFSDKEFREEYVESRVRNQIAYQIRALRDQRSQSQVELAEKLPKGTQSSVSRFEDPEYGRLSVTSLLELAAAFDVALTVRFCSHEEFLVQTSDVSPANLYVDSFDAERVQLHVITQQRGKTGLVFPMVVYGGTSAHFMKKMISLEFSPSRTENIPSFKVKSQ